MKDSKKIIDEDLSFITKNLDQELSQLSGKKVLVTGGAGFLGYYIVKTLLYWNKSNSELLPVSLIVYDNFLRGVPSWLEDHKKSKNFIIKNHDITEPLPASIEFVDFIIHAATIASPSYYRKYPIETMDANVNGLRHLLNYSIEIKKKDRPLSGFLFFSTSEIYGDPSPENIPTSEDYRGNVSCTGPRACYDESKRYGETMCVNFSKQYDLPIAIARPFNNYGPGLKLTDKRALPDFVSNILANRDVVLFSDGSPTRTFCYVADAIIGYFKVLVNGKKGESYNIGTEAPEISIKDLANMTVSLSKELFNYDGNVIMANNDDADYLIDNPDRRCPSIKKASFDLNYLPQITLKEGLTRSLIWYKDNKS